MPTPINYKQAHQKSALSRVLLGKAREDHKEDYSAPVPARTRERKTRQDTTARRREVLVWTPRIAAWPPPDGDTGEQGITAASRSLPFPCEKAKKRELTLSNRLRHNLITQL